MSIRFGFRKGMSNLPLFVAITQLEMLKKYDIELVSFNSPEEQINALVNNEIDISATNGISEHIRISEKNPAYLSNVKLFLFAFSTEQNAPDRILMQQNYNFSKLSDLKGKKIGYINSNTLKVNLELIFKVNLLNLSDYQFVPLTMKEQFDAFKSRQIDAIYTYEPYSTIISLSGAKVLIDKPSLEISNPYPAGAFGVNISFLNSYYDEFLKIKDILDSSIDLIRVTKLQALKSLINFFDIEENLLEYCKLYEWIKHSEIKDSLMNIINEYLKKLVQYNYLEKENDIIELILNLRRQ